MSANIPPGWYPDPAGPQGLRYWNGSAWTEATHPGSRQQAPTPMPNRPMAAGPTGPRTPKKRRRGRLIAILASAVTLVLVVTVGLVFHPFGIGSNLGDADGVSFQDPRYTWEKPRKIKSDEIIDVEANFDYKAECAKAEGSDDASNPCTRQQGSGRIVKLFADAAMTVRLNVMFLPSMSHKGNFTVEPTGESDKKIRKYEPGETYWGMHAEYYMVQYLDKDGQKLAKPSVTKIIPERTMKPPRVSFAKTADGDISLSWTKVEGATSYVIVTSMEKKDAGGRSLYTIGETKENSWSSESSVVESPSGPYVLTQNKDLTVFSGTSAEDVESGGFEQDTGDWAGFDIGVIAKNGNDISGYRSYNAARILSMLPNSIAGSRNAEALKEALKGSDDLPSSPEQLPTTFYYTALDGSTRATAARLDASSFSKTKIAGRYGVGITGVGTRLGYHFPVQTTLSPQEFSDQFNKIADAAAAKTGGQNAVQVVTAEEATLGGEKTVPKVPYPVYGSNPLTKAIGAHLIAQTDWINLEEFVDRPGAPDLGDAVHEAMAQNPYAGDTLTITVGTADLRVTYRDNLATTQARQKELKTKSDSVLKEIIKPDMDDAEKGTAINNWLVEHAEYDREAYNAHQEAERKAKDPRFIDLSFLNKYGYAFQAEGVLLKGKGVCASYSYAYSLLANAAGVETVYVSGDVANGGGHAWNKSKVNGTWKAIDVTWNDSPEGNRYLMISDKDFTDSAQRSEDDYWMIDNLISQYAAP